jgi:hypothetical protein
MFQQMINGSIAVLTRPSVATFEEHERNNLGWAVIYAGIGAVIAALLGAIGAAIAPPTTVDPATQQQLEGTPFESILTTASQPPSIAGATVSGLIGALLGFLLYAGLVFLIARAFGGTGAFGELAYDISLFYTPLAILNAVIALLVSAVPVIACLTWIVSLGAGIYNLFLTYLGIRAGMNVPQDKAILTMVIIFVASLILVCGLFAVIFALVAAVAGTSQ